MNSKERIISEKFFGMIFGFACIMTAYYINLVIAANLAPEVSNLWVVAWTLAFSQDLFVVQILKVLVNFAIIFQVGKMKNESCMRTILLRVMNRGILDSFR